VNNANPYLQDNIWDFKCQEKKIFFLGSSERPFRRLRSSVAKI